MRSGTGLSTYYAKSSGWIGLVIPGALWLAGTVVACFVLKPRYKPEVR